MINKISSNLEKVVIETRDLERSAQYDEYKGQKNLAEMKRKKAERKKLTTSPALAAALDKKQKAKGTDRYGLPINS